MVKTEANYFFASSCRLTVATFNGSRPTSVYLQQEGAMVTVPVDAFLRAVMITTAKTKVASASGQ